MNGPAPTLQFFCRSAVRRRRHAFNRQGQSWGFFSDGIGLGFLLAGPDTSSRILTGAEDSADAITSAFAGAWSWISSDVACSSMFAQIDEAPRLELRFGANAKGDVDGLVTYDAFIADFHAQGVKNTSG